MFENSRRLIVTRGCPASGKTTWAKEQIELGKADVRCNRDDIRREMHPSSKWPGYKYSKSNEKEVTKMQSARIAAWLSGDLTVIVDDTNLKEERFNRLLESYPAPVQIQTFFQVPLHTLIERNLQRKWSVPEDVIHRMFKKQLEIQNRIIEPDLGLPPAVIVDIDGTLADMRKGHPDGRGPFEWDKVLNDLPKHNVIEMVENLSEKYSIVFLTGRDGVVYEETLEWIEKHVELGIFQDGPHGLYHNRQPELYSRKANDTRPDCTIKEELLRKHVLPKYNVILAIDDRNQMVDHWRALGLETWQVDAGRF